MNTSVSVLSAEIKMQSAATKFVVWTLFRCYVLRSFSHDLIPTAAFQQ